MSELTGIEMTRSCAADLTRQINQASENLAGMLKRAHDEKAWRALGYTDWKSYVAAEIKFSKSRVFQLIDYETIRQELAESTMVDSLPSPTERAARELKPVPPAQRPAVYAAAVEAAGGKQPTAKQVEAAVVEVMEPERKSLPTYTPSVALDIADNAIRMLGTIHEKDKDRYSAGIKLVEWVNENLWTFGGEGKVAEALGKIINILWHNEPYVRARYIAELISRLPDEDQAIVMEELSYKKDESK